MKRLSPSPDVRAELDDLYNSYLWALDVRDADLYIAAFWPNAILTEDQLDGSALVFDNADGIREYTEHHFGEEQYIGYQHRETTRVYFADPQGRPDHWAVQSYWFASRRFPATNEVEFASTGYYRDVVSLRDDEWRFSTRRITRWSGYATHPYNVTSLD